MRKKFKIGVFGSAQGANQAAIEKARKIGEHISRYDCIFVSGAGPGVSYEAIKMAHQKGIETWGFSPARSFEEHQERYSKNKTQADQSIYNKLIYVPTDFQFADDARVARKYRNVISTASTYILA